MSEYNFPETNEEMIRNVAIAQSIMLDFLEGIVETMHGDEPELLSLWQAAKALNASVEVHNG